MLTKTKKFVFKIVVQTNRWPGYLPGDTSVLINVIGCGYLIAFLTFQPFRNNRKTWFPGKGFERRIYWLLIETGIMVNLHKRFQLDLKQPFWKNN